MKRKQFNEQLGGSKVFTIVFKLLKGQFRFDATLTDGSAEMRECLIQARLSHVVNIIINIIWNFIQI